MKKLTAILLSLVLLISCGMVYASDMPEAAEPTAAPDPNTETIAPANFEIPAKSGLLMDQTTGTVLYEKDSHAKMAPASVTKIMTMLLVMEALESGKITLKDPVTTSENAASMGGTQIWLEVGEQMTVEELLKATAVASANDAAMALAEHVGGSEEGFVAMMNNKAAELKMTDTLFVNPTGLDAEGHLSCAYDIALMSRELLRHKDITQYTSIWMDSLRGGQTELVNTNKLIRFYKGCTGLKTGTTDDAGSCVSVSASRDNMNLVSVVMGAVTSKDRFDGAKKLLDYGFANFVMFDANLSGDLLKPIKVLGGTAPEVEVEANEGTTVVIPKGKEQEIKQEVQIPADLQAPVLQGQKVGEITLTIDGEVIASFQLKAKLEVVEMTFFRAFLGLFKRLITM